MHSLGLEIAPNRVSDFCLAYYVCRIGGSFFVGGFDIVLCILDSRKDQGH